MESDRKLLMTINELIAVDNESTKNFYAAAEQVENRALKLLLKAYAQERTQFVRQLRAVVPQADREAAKPTSALNFFQRGWLDLKAAMVVRRQGRHQVLLDDLHDLEASAVDAYRKAAALSLPAAGQTVVNHQYERVRTVYDRVALVAKELEERLVLRLFNKTEDTDGVVRRLEQIGIPQRDLAVIPIEEIAVYQGDEQARPRATREAIITGGLLGLVVGGLLGLLYGTFHRFYFPELNGLIATSPTGVMLEMGMHGALIGMVFSLIFSTLIASSAAETDAYLYEDSFQNGDTLVAVFTDANTLTEAERALGLKHEHEIEPVTA
ncbi:MAG: PA2169 family four-helix-bundle protein [Caldilineaceae bacterium]